MISNQAATGNNLAEAFYYHSIATPERPALWVNNCEYSYGEIATKACQMVSSLAERFQGEKVHVGVFASRHLESYVGLLAALWGGHLYVPLNPRQPARYLRSVMVDAELKCIIADPSCKILLDKGLLQGLPTVVLAEDKPNGKTHEIDSFQKRELTAPHPVAANNLAYIMYTSGSTGTPKGIAATVGNVHHFLEASQSRYQLKADDRVSQFNDLYWDPSVFDLFSTWKVGASVHVVPETQLLFPTRFVEERQLSIYRLL
jgi:D-alanine--poly(phosphoribitol) ligase subunit 1